MIYTATLNKAASFLQQSLGFAEVVYLLTRSDVRLFNLAHLKSKTKVWGVLIRVILFADDAAVATHTQEKLQTLMNRFSGACRDFGLTISLKKTNVLGQDIEVPPIITIYPNPYIFQAILITTISSGDPRR